MFKIAASAALVLFACAGCDSSASGQRPKTVPVKGVVTYKGKPLSQGDVLFEPDRGNEATAKIQPDGSFELTTYEKGDGAIAGTHRVSISGTAKGKNKEAIPAKYKSLSLSQIEVEVASGKTDYPIDLQ